MDSIQGYGERISLHRFPRDRGASYVEFLHYAIENGKWIRQASTTPITNLSVREQNELRLVVTNEIATVFINGYELQHRSGYSEKIKLALTLPSADQLKITPFSTGSDIVDFKDYSVKCLN